MAARFPTTHWLPSLTLAVALAGCALSPPPRTEPFRATPSPPVKITEAPPLNAGGAWVPAARTAEPPVAPPVKITEATKKPAEDTVVRPAGNSEPPQEPRRLAPQPKAADLASNPLRALHRMCAQRYEAIDGYLARLRRRERVGESDLPEEVILLKFRKDPWSVYLKWLGQEGQGREVVYVRGALNDEIHAVTGAGDVAFARPGKRINVAHDSPLVLARSRYSIHEAVVGALIERYGKLVDAAERGDPKAGTLRYLGPIQRREFARPVEAVMQTVPAGAERQLPRGGQRFWFFDTQVRFPVLVVAQEPDGADVEYYCYDQFYFPGAGFREEEFDPDRLWPR